MNIVIPPPPETPSVADADTAKNPDYTGPKANNRVLHITTRWIRYGTDDKGHAAALVLSVMLLGVAVVVSAIGIAVQYSAQEAPWLNTLITWVGNAFLFTAGIAVGKGKASTQDKTND